MAVEIRLLAPGDDAVLRAVAPGVFDNAIDPQLTAAFLRDPRHHLAVAIENGQVVGFASGVHYLHPDKPAELWVNEVGVAPTHLRRGLGQAVLRRLLECGAELGCRQAWVLTEPDNAGAMALYASVGGAEVSPPPVMLEFALGRFSR